MTSVKLAWVLGGMVAFGLGVAAEGCSSSSSSGTSPGTDAGHQGTGTGTSTGSSTGSGTSIAPGIDGGQGTSSGSGSGSDTDAGCRKAPPKLHPETNAGVYCPFSEVGDAGPVTCAAGKECCVTPEGSSMVSSCQAYTAATRDTACPVAGSTVIECEGTPDCAGTAGNICCAYGHVATQAACGTVPAYPYVSGFAYGPSDVKGSGGTFCAATCTATTLDGGPLSTIQICSQSCECGSGGVCTAIEPSGVGMGYCSTVGTGPSTCAATDAGSSGSGSGTGTSKDGGTDTGS